VTNGTSKTLQKLQLPLDFPNMTDQKKKVFRNSSSQKASSIVSIFWDVPTLIDRAPAS
jgi:hypothetical protein